MPKLQISFLLCIFGAIAMVPLHFLSVEHLRLEKKYGKEKGTKISKILGLISGWGFFLFWIGLWISPQPQFTLNILQDLTLSFPIVSFSTPLPHLILCILLLPLGAWLGIKAVTETTLETAETHWTERIVTTGVYSIVRHPQYLGGLLSHLGISFLLSAAYSLIVTPLMITLVFLIARKEEQELTKEFGKEYTDYQATVPMFIPRR